MPGVLSRLPEGKDKLSFTYRLFMLDNEQGLSYIVATSRTETPTPEVKMALQIDRMVSAYTVIAFVGVDGKQGENLWAELEGWKAFSAT